ncbi:MAG TPA: tetratricopeptide repeat protein, partial [Kofleriaceae bacterium]|nr:tetratricopeptide repeat protein [Kofleriaceae bacterium]
TNARAAVGALPADPLAAARDAHTRGLVRRALALLDLAIEAKPDDPAAYAEKGRQLFFASFPEHAATLLKRAIALGDQTPSTHGWLGAVLADTPEQADAVPLLQRAVQGELDGGMWWHSWVRLLVRLDRIDEAEAELSRALALPLDARWHGGLLTEKVNVLCARKRPADALEAADAALQLAPGSDYAHFVRGRALGMLGRLDEAELEMDKILHNTPNHADATRAKQVYAAARARRQAKR